MVIKNKIVYRWFRNVISLLVVLIALYLILHQIHQGKEYYKLTANEISDINLILNSEAAESSRDTFSDKKPGQADSVEPREKAVTKAKAKETPVVTPAKVEKVSAGPNRADTLKNLVFGYIYSRYNPASREDSISTVKYFARFSTKTFGSIISQYPFKFKSYFWLTDWWAYLEVLFWSLFGLICSLLFNVSEAVSRKQFDQDQEPVHLAKLFYTPFIALIIYLGIDLLTLNKDISISMYGNGLIVFSFILGFFTRRAIDLLDRLKEIIIPGKERETDKTIDQPAEAPTEAIIQEAIQEKGEEWVNSFPNVTGLSVRNKILDGKDTGTCALIFKVRKKEKMLDFGNIPEFVSYQSKSDGKKYSIPTDVIQEDMPKSHIAKKDQPPFELGISISREYDDTTGTIGLFLEKFDDSGKIYAISCYHVFCAPELKASNKQFPKPDQSAVLRCASHEDHGTNKIGWVVAGQVDSENDFAIAELKEGTEATNKLFLPPDQSIVPDGFIFVNPEDQNKKVKMCGRTSGFQTGKIKSHYASQTINYGNKVFQYIQGLVEITPISKGGDSGAAVLDENNKVIGLIVSGNEESSYVLPVKKYIVKNNYTLFKPKSI